MDDDNLLWGFLVVVWFFGVVAGVIGTLCEAYSYFHYGHFF